MKIKPGTIVLIVILAIVLFFAGTLFTYQGLKPILVPAISCGIIIVLGIAQLFKELSESAKQTGTAGENSKTAEADEKEAKHKNKKYLAGFSWLVGYALGIYLIGFIYGTFLFIILFIRIDGGRSWLKSGTVAVLVTAAFWVSFVYFLQTDLWSGAIFNWLNLGLPTLTEI